MNRPCLLVVYVLACASLSGATFACSGSQSPEEDPTGSSDTGEGNVSESGEVVFETESEFTIRVASAGEICESICAVGTRCPNTSEFDDPLECMDACIDRYADQDLECRQAALALSQCAVSLPCQLLEMSQPPIECEDEVAATGRACAQTSRDPLEGLDLPDEDPAGTPQPDE